MIRALSWCSAIAGLAMAMAIGCTFRLGSGGEGAGGSGNDSESGGGEAGSSAGPSEEEIQEGEDAYAQLDQLELALASAKAGHMTCALSGAVDAGIQAQGLDPNVLSEEDLLALIEQYLPGAVDQAELWLVDVDPSSLAYTVKPKPECVDQGCVYSAKCQPPFYIPEVNHRCFIDDCGPAKCRTCPDFVNNILQNIAYKTWCSYVCVQTATAPPKVVAVGAGFVSKLLGIFGGPFCIAYP